MTGLRNADPRILNFSWILVFRIRYGLNADPGPVIYLYADPCFDIIREQKFHISPFRFSFILFYLITHLK